MQWFPPTLQPGYRWSGRLEYLSLPWSAVLSNEQSCILPKVLLPPCPALMHRLQAQRQIKSPECMSLPAAKESVSAAVFYPSCSWQMCFLFHHTFSNGPMGHFVVIFQSNSRLTTSFQNQNLLMKGKMMTSCPLFSGYEKGILENIYNSIELTWILRTDCQKWQPKKDWKMQYLFSWLNLS